MEMMAYMSKTLVCNYQDQLYFIFLKQELIPVFLSIAFVASAAVVQ